MREITTTSILVLLLIQYFISPASAQSQAQPIILRQELEDLKREVTAQRIASEQLTQKINVLIENQEGFTNLGKDLKILFSNLTSSINQKDRFIDAVILDKNGRPFGLVENDLKIYEFNGGDLIGWINENNEIIKNSDRSIIGTIEENFIIDSTGHPIASIERSENLRWSREKLYSQIQKTPESHFFIPNNPQPFNPSRFRFSTWSGQDLNMLLYFNSEEVQKLR